MNSRVPKTATGYPLPNPSPATQKRLLDPVASDGDDSKSPLKRPRLTRKNLALLDKMEKKTSAPPGSTDDSSSTAETTSTTTSAFAMQAFRNGMLPPRDSRPPTNLQAIRERHARSRASGSPSESRFRHYVNRVERACNKATMVAVVGWRLLKDSDDGGYKMVLDNEFDGFPQEVGFNNGMSAPRPDFAEGLEMRAFSPFRTIDEHIEGAVLYEDDPGSLTLPHLGGEWEAGGGRDMKKAELKSGYDGAALVYARNQALSFAGKPDPPGHAEVTTFTTDGTSLDFYAHYAALGEEGKMEYHQYRFKSGA